ncbi:MAG: hypothetical protein HQ558_01295 [Candidatus Omnitrophica bacterium]|nr:hypothetical protein [Candidatus Omnitrophota bacterium]
MIAYFRENICDNIDEKRQNLPGGENSEVLRRNLQTFSILLANLRFKRELQAAVLSGFKDSKPQYLGTEHFEESALGMAFTVLGLTLYGYDDEAQGYVGERLKACLEESAKRFGVYYLSLKKKQYSPSPVSEALRNFLGKMDDDLASLPYADETSKRTCEELLDRFDPHCRVLDTVRQDIRQKRDYAGRKDIAEALMEDIRPLSGLFGRTGFSSSLEESETLKHVTRVMVDAIEECMGIPDPQNPSAAGKKEEASFRRELEANALLLENLGFKRGLEAIIGTSWRLPEKAAKSREDLLIDLTQFAVELSLYGYSDRDVRYVRDRVRARLRGMSSALSIWFAQNPGHPLDAWKIIDQYIDRLVDHVYHLRNKQSKNRQTCIRALDGEEPYFLNRIIGECEEWLRRQEREARSAPAAYREDRYEKRDPVFREPPSMLAGKQAMLQNMQMRVGQAMVLSMTQVAGLLFSVDQRIKDAVENRQPLSEKALQAIEEDLREGAEGIFDGLRKDIVKTDEEGVELDAERDKFINFLIADTRRRAMIQLAHIPEITDLRSQRVSEIARDHVRTTDAGNLFFSRKDEVRRLTYDTMQLLKTFSIAPLFFEGAGGLSLETDPRALSARMISAFDAKTLEPMATKDLEQFLSATDELLLWLEKNFTGTFSRGSIQIGSSHPSNRLPPSLKEDLSRLNRQAKTSLSPDMSLAERLEEYISLYQQVVGFADSSATFFHQRAREPWTELDDTAQRALYRDMKMARQGKGLTLLGPELQDAEESTFTRVTFLDIPKARACPKRAQVVSLGGDFYAWMVDEALRLYADNNGIVATKDRLRRMRGESAGACAYIFRLADITKVIVLGDKIGGEDADRARITAALGKLDIAQKDIVFTDATSSDESLFVSSGARPEEERTEVEADETATAEKIAAVMIASYRGQILLPRRTVRRNGGALSLFDASVSVAVGAKETYKKAAARGLREQWGIRVKPDELMRLGEKNIIEVDAFGKEQRASLFIVVLSDRDERLSPQQSTTEVARYVWLKDFAGVCRRRPEYFTPVMREVLENEYVTISLMQQAYLQRQLKLCEEIYGPCRIRDVVVDPRGLFITQEQIFQSHLRRLDIEKLEEGQMGTYIHPTLLVKPEQRDWRTYILDGHHRSFKLAGREKLAHAKRIEPVHSSGMTPVNFGSMPKLRVVMDVERIKNRIGQFKKAKTYFRTAASRISRMAFIDDVNLAMVIAEAVKEEDVYMARVAREALAKFMVGMQIGRLRDLHDLSALYPPSPRTPDARTILERRALVSAIDSAA